MIHSTSHRFIASASSAAVTLTMLVAAGALAQDAAPGDAVVAVEPPRVGAASPTATPLQARIIDVSGKARWRASADAEWKEASVNDDLSPGAEIRTGMRSRVTLRFRNATVLVDSSTNFSIPTIEQEGDVLRTIAAVRSGRADFKVDKVGLENDFKVVTPSTTLAVRGTSFSTITGPLKGVEIVGARENAIRAIEVRYAALNQVVEMSGGAETRSTSDTPNPTEHALGSTFNVPQAGMIASKEEAQQGAFSGSSAPQTQRQSTTTVVGVNQVKQDIDAAGRGESGNGSLALLIDISRAAGFRAVAQDAGAEQAGALMDVLEAAQLAQSRSDAAQAAADSFVNARSSAESALAHAETLIMDALSSSGAALSQADAVRTSGASALSAFASGLGGPSVTGHVASAQESAQAGLSAAGTAGGQVQGAQARIADASALSVPLPSLSDQFDLARAALEVARAAVAGHTADVQRLRDVAAAASAAAQALAAGRDVPQITQSALLAAQAAAEAAQRMLEAGAARDEAEALAAQALARAQDIVRDALVQEIESATVALAATSSVVANASGTAQQASEDAALLDAGVSAMLLAESGAAGASQAAEDAERARDVAVGRQVAAQGQADLARGLGDLVLTQRGIALAELQGALAALEQCSVHADATSALVGQVDDALGQSTPDLDAAGAAASLALDQAASAQAQADLATLASERSDSAALAAGAVVDSETFTGSESLYTEQLQALALDVQDADMARGDAAVAAGVANLGASGASSLADQLEAAFGASARDAVSAAEQLAQHASSRAADAQLAFSAAHAAYEGAVSAGRSAAQVTVWAAVRAIAAQAREDADAALLAAQQARELATAALAQAQGADERVAVVTGGMLASSAQQASMQQAGALQGVLDAAELAHERFVALSEAAGSFESRREEAMDALARAREALVAAEREELSAASGAQGVVDGGNSAFRAFVAQSADAVVRDHQAMARESAASAAGAVAALSGHVEEAAGQSGIASAASAQFPGLASQFAQARTAFDEANALLASSDADVTRLRDVALAAHEAVRALAELRDLPQLQQSLLLAAQAAAEAVQRAADAGVARDGVAALAAMALLRAQGIVHEALTQEIQSTAQSVVQLQVRMQDAASAAQQAQDHLALLDAAIDGMLLARTGAQEAAAAADAADAFRGFAEGRRDAAQAQADVASGVGVLVDGHRLAALAQMQLALDALASCRDSAIATSAFARTVSDALALETPDVGAAGSAAAQALGAALLAEQHAGDSAVAAGSADAAANAAHTAVMATSFTGSESLYAALVSEALSGADGAGVARDATQVASDASASGASAATALQQQLASAFGGSDAIAAVAAAEQLAAAAAARASDAQAAYVAAQAAYSGAVAAGRSSAEVTVWGAVRAVALQARQDANAALSAAAEAQRLAGIAMAEAMAAEAAVSGAGFPPLAQMSREAAESARASALSGMSELLSLVQAHQQVLDQSGAAVAQAFAALGSTLAATEVAQSSASGVAGQLVSVRDAVAAFMDSSQSVGTSGSDVQQLLTILLNARNEGLGLAMAAGASAADVGAAVALHAQQRASDDWGNAQAQAAGIEAILASTATALGTDTDDPRLGLLRALHDRAMERADAAGASASQALAAAGDAAAAQSEARDALAALGLFPAWDLSTSYGADISGAAGAAAAAAANAVAASRGASVLVAFHGAAQSGAQSVDASDQGASAALEAQGIAAGAAAAARSAANQVSDSGRPNSERAQALATIAGVQGQVNALQAQSNSSVNLVNGRLDALLLQLASGNVDAAAALASLDGARSAASVARENADTAAEVGQGALSTSAQFQQFVLAMGTGGEEALQAIESLDSNQLAAAASFRQMAEQHQVELQSFVAAVIAAAAAGEDLTVAELAVAALWIRSAAESELQRLQDAVAAAQDARADAELAADELRSAVATASGPVMDAAQQAVDAAEQFLRQVIALQIEVTLGERAVEGEVARNAASLVDAQVASRAIEVAVTVGDIRSAIEDYTAATSSMTAAVSAAQEARTLAESRLTSLEGALLASDARLVSIRGNLAAGDRGLAGADGEFIAARATESGSLAQQADAARASALLALSGIDSLGADASGAIARMDGGLSASSSHQFALGVHLQQAEDAFNAASAAQDGVGDMMAEASTPRGTALGAHALEASGEALSRAGAALAGIAAAGGSLEAALVDAGSVNRDVAGLREGQGAELREWVASLDYGSSSIPVLISDRVLAMSGVAQGVIGSYDSRAAAMAAASAAEGARDRAGAADYVALQALEVHHSALVGVNQEHVAASIHRDIASDELLTATGFRVEAGFWLQQTIVYVSQSDAFGAASAAGVTGEKATGAEDAASRSDAAAAVAWDAGVRATEWAALSAGAYATASDAAHGAELESGAASGFASDAVAARSAAASFTAATEQFAAIAATAAADDASAFARQMRDSAVAQAVLAESARDAAHAAAASARTRANQIVFSAVAAKAQQTVDLAQQARHFADGAIAQAQAARSDANSAVAAASSIAGGTQ